MIVKLKDTQSTIGTFLMSPQDTENIKHRMKREMKRDTARHLTKSWLNQLGKNQLYKP